MFYLAQHVPRTNGEIPSIDEATTDHQRLLDRYFFIDFFITSNSYLQSLGGSSLPDVLFILTTGCSYMI